MARQSSHRHCPCQTFGEMVRVPVPSRWPSGRDLDWVSRPVAPFDGLRHFQVHKTHIAIDIRVHTHTHTHHIQYTLSLTHARRSVPSPVGPELQIPSRKPVERQRSAECVPPLAWHERDIPVSQRGERGMLLAAHPFVLSVSCWGAHLRPSCHPQTFRPAFSLLLFSSFLRLFI